jgi:hypothetical protein
VIAKNSIKILNSKYWIALIMAIVIITNFKYHRWNVPGAKVIWWDITNYYGYLPAVFVHNDIKLSFINDSNKDYYAGNMMFWPDIAPNGGKSIRTTMGLAFCYLPFFLIAHAYSKLFLNFEVSGFEDHYEMAIVFSSAFYLLISLIYIRKILRKYGFSETIIILCMLAIAMGSNVLNYVTLEAPMTHNYLLTMGLALIYHTINWHENFKIKYIWYIGLLLGWMTLIRPTCILFSLYFIFYNVHSIEAAKEKFMLFKTHFFQLLLIPVLGFLCFLPQLIYWKINTDHFIYYSYQDAKFFWQYPMIMPGLFSYRKGWLLYSPIFIFSFIGIIYMIKNRDRQGINTLISTVIIIYVIFSWCSWYYGGSFSCRALIDYYGILLLPMALMLKKIFESKKWIMAPSVLIFMLAIMYGTFKNYQYYKGIVHYTCMTKTLFWKTFWSVEMPHDYYNYLICPDEEKTANGIEEYYFDPFRP